jgi:hypothetical protein
MAAHGGAAGAAEAAGAPQAAPPPPPQPRVVGAWRLHAQIGAGSFATVHRAAHVEHGGAAAVKEIDTRRLSGKLSEALAGEVAVLRAASAHAHIVRLIDTLQARGVTWRMCACGAARTGRGWGARGARCAALRVRLALRRVCHVFRGF